MAQQLSSHSATHPNLGRRPLKALLTTLILLITMGPGYGSDDGGEESGGGCGGGANQSYYADEAYEDYEEAYERGEGINLQAGGYTDTVTGDASIKRLLSGTSNRTDLRLPGYSYFQGVIQAKKHLMVAGQVRVVGAVLGSDEETASFYSGAMVTTNAHALVGAGASLDGMPAGIRTRIRAWEEVPAP